MKYIADGTVSTRDEVAGALRRFVRYPTLYPDLGIWHTSRRDTGAFIGFFALKYTGKSTDIEIGYRLLHDAWGLGFATEGATALVALRLRRPGARPHHRRHASGQQGVAERADEGGAGRPGLGPLLQPPAAPVRGGTRRLMTPTVRQALAQCGLVPVDAKVLLAHVLGCNRAWLAAHETDALTQDEASAFAALCNRRRDGEPVAYLTGTREFWGLDARRHARRADPAAGNRDAGRICAVEAAARSRGARARPGHRFRRHRAGAGARPARCRRARDRPFGRGARPSLAATRSA